MIGTKGLFCALLAVGLAWAGDSTGDSSIQQKARLDFARVPLSFEPNLGQSDPSARFIAKSPGYSLRLEPAGARFQFGGRDKAPASIGMDLEKPTASPRSPVSCRCPGRQTIFPLATPKPGSPTFPLIRAFATRVFTPASILPSMAPPTVWNTIS